MDGFDDLPGLAGFGEALADRARGEELAELGLAAFGDALAGRARRRPPRRRLHAFALAAALALPIAATSGAATALVLRTADVGATDPAQLPDEQTPLAGTAHVSPVRAKDPAGGYPWALRVARGKTGLACTTVGQVHEGVFGLVGLDGVFRRLPGELSDACGDAGVLVGARVVDGAPARTIVYGVAGKGLRGATLLTATGERRLRIGPGGTFVAAVAGYPEDQAVAVRLAFPGRTEEHAFGTASGTLVDPEGGQAWKVELLKLGTRLRCARVRIARAAHDGDPSTPTACLGLRTTDRAWVAAARRFSAGQSGAPGFDGWSWYRHAPRTLVWGVARTTRTLTSVTLLGAGPPRRVAISKQGVFAAILHATADPAALRLRVRLADGTTQTGRPGEGLVPDLVKSRR